MYNILFILFMIGMFVDIIMITPVGIYWLIDCVSENKTCYPLIIVLTISPMLVIIGSCLGFE